jgi:hypothetical protein
VSVAICCGSQTACASQPNGPVTSPAACSVWKPIIYSRLQDTADTIRQVLTNNAAQEAFCGR